MDFLGDYGGVDAAPWAGGLSPSEYSATLGSSGGASSSGDWVGAVTSLFGAGVKAYADVKTTDAKARMMTQYSPYGGYYTEGMAGRYPGQQMSPLLLLLIAGGLLFALKG